MFRVHNKARTIFIFLIVLGLLPTGVVSAIIPINATDIGQTYILWNWTPGYNLTDLYIDGNVMCGYETTSNTYLLAGLDADTPHTIQIFTVSDSGTNTTSTVPCPPEGCAGGSGTGGNQMMVENDLPISPVVPLAATALVFLLAGRRKFRM